MQTNQSPHWVTIVADLCLRYCGGIYDLASRSRGPQHSKCTCVRFVNPVIQVWRVTRKPEMRCLHPCLLAELLRRFPVPQANQRFALGHLSEVADFLHAERNRI